jgi:PAS domain S-box-containing protein
MFLFLSRLSLKYRIALVIFVLEALMLSAVLWVTFSESQQTARAQHAATTNVIVDMLSELASAALLTEEYADIQFYFDQVENEPTVLRVLLADISGKVVAASNVGDIGRQLPVLANASGSFWIDRAIEYPAGQLGTLAIEFSTQPLEHSYAQTRARAISIAVIGMGVIMVVGLVVGIALTRRLEALTLAARKFAAGDVSVQANITGNDEVGRLGQTFDHMVKEVSSNQQKITEQTERIRLLMDSTAEGIFGLDVNGVFTFINNSALKMLGYTSQESLIGRSMYDLLQHHLADGSNYPIDDCHLLACLDKGEDCHSEDEVFWRNDGSSFPVEYWAHPMERNGERIGAVVAFVEISQRKKAEAEMQRLNSELENLLQERTYKLQEQATILDQIHDSVVVTDMQGHVTGWNKGAERLFGFSTEQAMGRHIAFVYPEYQHEFLEQNVIKPLLEKGEHETEVIMRNKDGGRVDAHVSLSLLRDKDRVPINMVAYSLDIADRKRAEQEQAEAMRQATEASRAKTEFLSRMSHELRTPMNAILGFGQLLESDASHPLSEAQKQSVQEILHAGNHLLELINEVLDLSRIEAGKLAVSHESFPLLPLLKECYTMVSPLGEEYGIRLMSLGHGCARIVRADRTRLKQVLINLLSNAIKYNRKMGSVSVSCSMLDDKIQISVTDTGSGMTPDQLDQLFVPFERLDADKKQIEGTGIGLALSKRLMEMMDGQIGAQSTPGVGSTFWLRLPQGDDTTQSMSPVDDESAEEAIAEQGETSHKVLCIEDNPANLRLVEAILGRREHLRLLSASEPSMGLELARTQQPALILLDINLPDMDGYEVMQCLQENAATQHIPVVAITAKAMPQDLERGKAAGFLDYLTKPLDMSRLLAVVDEVLAGEADSN